MSLMEFIGFAFLGFCAYMAGQGGGGAGRRGRSAGAGHAIIGRKYEYKGVSKLIKNIVNRRKF